MFQQRISDLKGVVSLDRFEDVVSQLTDETVSDTTKVRLLKSLREKQPATQVIQVGLTNDSIYGFTDHMKGIERNCPFDHLVNFVRYPHPNPVV